jgi:hypothetical protein
MADALAIIALPDQWVWRTVFGCDRNNNYRTRLINPVDDPYTSYLSKMAAISCNQRCLIRKDDTRDEQIGTPNLSIRFVGTEVIELNCRCLVEWHNQNLREEFFSSREPLLCAQEFRAGRRFE